MMGWIFMGITACLLLGWYLSHRSKKNNTTEDTGMDADVEDLLWTGVLLSEIYDDDEHSDSSDDIGTDDYSADGGGFDGGGFE